jgi:hypothetical protein
MTVRGNYYREASTRVLAPVVYVEKDVPDERFTVGAEYLLDAVTSASIGAGAAAVTGGDFLFTEYRHETTLRLSSKLRNWSARRLLPLLDRERLDLAQLRPRASPASCSTAPAP